MHLQDGNTGRWLLGSNDKYQIGSIFMVSVQFTKSWNIIGQQISE
jgi:hypothetical protein